MPTIEDLLIQPGGLADRLRSLREAAGLSGKELAAALNWAASKVSRLEHGKQAPSLADLGAWAAACGAPAAADELSELLSEVRDVHRDWHRRMRAGVAPVQRSYNDLVAQSATVAHFETVYVPGLLQTAAYARRIIGEMVDLHGLAVDDVDAAVAARLERQRHLYDTSKRFTFLLAEPVLHWRLCPPDVTRLQLDRLASAVDLPHVRFGILPFSALLPITPQNSFQLYDSTAVVETITSELVCSEDESAAYGRALDHLWRFAVEGPDALALIAAARR
ncbi:transcriptional regulator [Catellatospora methionotrophica]|uniref:Transcriptional regulator n=1 Tax=Catellatospora methionotrophica TaxID=121620 RepID=A0A8J3L6M8_9ACTN|nr:helix-turn-helix transcriptional regulator [Catellatospora methionotrophica]GIG13147.1 transcriptional regulator [Catellatospora methionotrophica]